MRRPTEYDNFELGFGLNDPIAGSRQRFRVSRQSLAQAGPRFAPSIARWSYKGLKFERPAAADLAWARLRPV